MKTIVRKRALNYNIRYDEHNLGRCISVPLTPARYRVEIQRAPVDVAKSKQGTTVGCVNSNCALRTAREGAFPHPVYLAVFTKSRAYFVDKLDSKGQPRHAVFYAHKDGQSIDLNDTIPDRFELLQKLDLRRPLVLFPPQSNRVGIDTSHWKQTTARRPKNAKTPKRRAVNRGATERARKAGLLVLP